MANLPYPMKYSLTFLSLLVAVGCSSTDEAETDVWGPRSSALSLDVRGGLQGYNETFSYDRSTASVVYDCQRFCSVGFEFMDGPVQLSVELAPAVDEELRAKLDTLAVSNDRSRCYIDAKEHQIIVTSPSATQAFVDDATAGCAGAVERPLVPYEAADELHRKFESVLR